MMSEDDQQSPTDYKLQLGAVLAEKRARAGKTRGDAAALLECSEAKIGTIERGRTSMSPRELRDLLDLYEVTGPERADIEVLAKGARQRRLPTPWGSAVPPRLRQFFQIEETAVSIRHYHPELIHGITQTEPYARALISNNTALRPAEVERFVQARMARQARLDGQRPVRFTMVLPEAALHLVIGGADVMRDQLRHLIDLVDRGKADVRVIPSDVGMHASRGFPFTILTPAARRKTVVYLENLTDGIFVDDDHRVEQYEAAFAQLLLAALSPADTVTLLATVASEL